MRKLSRDVKMFLDFAKFYQLHWLMLPWLASVPWILFWLDRFHRDQDHLLEEQIEISFPCEVTDDR